MKQEIEYKMPLIGEEFPKLSVQTTHGKKSIPNDYKGKWFVLFSHPADFTPVCTTEFIGFQNRFDKFKELDTELIGLSIDQVFSHMKWAEWINEKMNVKIQFPIIADDNGDIAKQLGMIHPGKGKNTVRAVFIVDPEGIIRLILYYPQEVGRNMDEIVRAVKALQTSDKNKVAMPANWPNNDIIEDNVIIPPATSEDEAKERMADKSLTCKDWWFCYKKLE